VTRIKGLVLPYHHQQRIFYTASSGSEFSSLKFTLGQMPQTAILFSSSTLPLWKFHVARNFKKILYWW